LWDLGAYEFMNGLKRPDAPPNLRIVKWTYNFNKLK
jgi:hypothetical protein